MTRTKKKKKKQILQGLFLENNFIKTKNKIIYIIKIL